jgi:NAD(P)-dependent dehydrogenase (short-subunit alcohol dehydrogenase family)
MLWRRFLLILLIGTCAPLLSRAVLFPTQVVVGASAAVALAVWLQQQVDRTVFIPTSHSLAGQAFLITGGTTGLGLETAKRVALGGPAHIILTARTSSKGEAALLDIRSYLHEREIDTTNLKLEYRILDLDSLEGIREAVGSWKDLPVLNCLVNNAGIMALPSRELTVDGMERQMQVNHLGHFALTALLAPYLARDVRIVNVSSLAHKIAINGLDLDYAWTGEPSYWGWKSYGQSKLANMLFSQELQRRADAVGLSWQVSSLHPGSILTDLGRHLMTSPSYWLTPKNGEGLVGSTLHAIASLFCKTVEEGASTQVYLAAGAGAEREAPRGRYYVNRKPRSVEARAIDAVMAERLWTESEVRSGIAFSLASPDA